LRGLFVCDGNGVLRTYLCVLDEWCVCTEIGVATDGISL
jgi:hypothetical protein